MQKILAFTLILLSFSGIAHAQSSVAGAVGGTVTDPSNAVVPNAMVTLTNVGTNKEETITTEADGRFKFNNLQPGAYKVSVKTSGFAEYSQEVVVEVGRTSTVDASLNVGGAQAE